MPPKRNSRTARRSPNDGTGDLFAALGSAAAHGEPPAVTPSVPAEIDPAASNSVAGTACPEEQEGAGSSREPIRVAPSAANVPMETRGGVPRAPGKAADAAEPTVPSGDDEAPPEGPLRILEVLPARMLNEFVYCPRLFFYEHVLGVFVENDDTVRGAAIHSRVDRGRGAMPAAADPVDDDAGKAEAPTGGEIHSRSVMLSSERLGVVAKMDLVESTVDATGAAAEVCPVDYKAGAPREGETGLTLWDTDRMQLGLQCAVLRENGYQCSAGVIFYRQTKQRVRMEFTPELEAWLERQISAARETSQGAIPPPLVDSPKCVRCSLAPVCLPDETRMLSVPTAEKYRLAPDESAPAGEEAATPAPRRLVAARDEKRALYLNTQGFRVGCNDAVLKIKESRAARRGRMESIDAETLATAGERLVEEVRLLDVDHVAVFGNIQLSTQAVQRLCDEDIPVTWFSSGGWFYGITRGHSLKNVLLRIDQFRSAADPLVCLRLAREFVRGKIHNHRVLFMRNHVEPPERTKLRLGRAREEALAAGSLEELLGVEGAAAAAYFQQFGGMIRGPVEDDFLEGLEPAPGEGKPPEPRFNFDFTTRNRRPPTDPVNALLSLAYSLLAKECTLAAVAVGLDPYVGFYHQPRHGRPALALDVMEEFRPLIAESAVLSAINNRFVSPHDFVRAGQAVNLSAHGRRQFFQCFEQRINALVTHPVFDYKVSYRRALELQFRILARVLAREIPDYVPFLSR